MYKKLFITSVLCIGLMMVLGIRNADAFRLAGFLFNPGGSVYCDSEWRGVGNLDKEDSYAEVECQIQPTLVTVSCSNHGGGIGGLGTPFVTSSVIAINEILNENSLSGKGRTLSKIYFSDELLFNSLFPEGYIFPEDTCDQNHNWSVATPDEGGIVIIVETWVTLNGYSAPDVLEDSGTFYCTLNAAGDEYSCE